VLVAVSTRLRALGGVQIQYLNQRRRPRFLSRKSAVGRGSSRKQRHISLHVQAFGNFWVDRLLVSAGAPSACRTKWRVVYGSCGSFIDHRGGSFDHSFILSDRNVPVNVKCGTRTTPKFARPRSFAGRANYGLKYLASTASTRSSAAPFIRNSKPYWPIRVGVPVGMMRACRPALASIGLALSYLPPISFFPS
jgi:hypothetical protein